MRRREKMEIRYEKHWSSYLNRDMEFKIYGACCSFILLAALLPFPIFVLVFDYPATIGPL